ncbi:DUF2777 family protein [Bacillus pinisoli]|uniref:DUF2777 family protein n=1 Tax=Bacillus pinisoli TaxID=2901866 RepID=UPI001FF6450A|nr:DUF2777 family protein [Bacillus pinisoli]
MKLQQRLEQLPFQERAYMIGSVEAIHDQWVFFDEQDEPSALTDILNEPFEIKGKHGWETFHTFENGIAIGPYSYPIKNGDSFKIKKPLTYVYQEWLNELTDESFTRFIHLINAMNFSVYDCIYCHNFLFYQVTKKQRDGVNFITFDNGEQLCSVHHHYQRGIPHSDRFELTLNNGKRHILTSL